MNRHHMLLDPCHLLAFLDYSEILQYLHFPFLEYTLLQQPDGRHYMIGDQISYHSSWQEGAFASAEVALLDLNDRVRAASSVTRKA